MNPLLIIISGSPGAGKTTLGQRIADELSLPFVHKDGIKEVLFDTIGYAGKEDRTKSLQCTSYALLYHFVAIQGKAGKSVVIESNFMDNFDTAKITQLKDQYNFQIVQILCNANDEVLFERFKQRTHTGERHPGHSDHQKFDEFKKALMEGRQYKLALACQLIELDTNDFNRIDYSKIFGQLRVMVG